MLITRIFFLSILTLCFNSLAAYPPDYTAVYDIEAYGTTIAESVIQLKRSKNKAHYSQNVKLVGITSWFKSDRVSENSWLTKTDDGHYLFEKYQYVHSHSKKNRDSLLEATWSTKDSLAISGEITGQMRGKPVSITSNEKIWDTLSFQLELINDITSRNTTYHYNVLSRGEVNRYTFTLVGEKTITINDKKYKTIQLNRVSRNKLTKIWLATNLNYIPVLLKKYKDNDLDSIMSIKTISFKSTQHKTKQVNSNER